ncbi:hypothetical protein PUN28_018500 [Cardiocondyla obscurior]|uniref:Secreted protein n=1 Tax=Cardiocondyla obscurior TaxID=286306 RepID=A0AAW2EFJ2_9HYME
MRPRLIAAGMRPLPSCVLFLSPFAKSSPHRFRHARRIRPSRGEIDRRLPYLDQPPFPPLPLSFPPPNEFANTFIHVSFSLSKCLSIIIKAFSFFATSSPE